MAAPASRPRWWAWRKPSPAWSPAQVVDQARRLAAADLGRLPWWLNLLPKPLAEPRERHARQPARPPRTGPTCGSPPAAPPCRCRSAPSAGRVARASSCRSRTRASRPQMFDLVIPPQHDRMSRRQYLSDHRLAAPGDAPAAGGRVRGVQATVIEPLPGIRKRGGADRRQVQGLRPVQRARGPDRPFDPDPAGAGGRQPA